MGLIDSVKNKLEELKERKEFLDMVERKAKPIRRAAYMKQMLKESVEEGMQKAKAYSDSRKPKKKKKTEEDFGIKGINIGGSVGDPLEDPLKYLKAKEEKPKEKPKTKKKKEKK